MTTTRYFDQALNAWVTVYPPGVAEGAARGDLVAAKGKGARGWGAAKAARKAQGKGKRRRSGAR
jgi:hypothetical protein